jgi:hypothetical protein
MTKIGKITLIKETQTTDTIGQLVTTESTTDVIAEVKSVSQSEYMSGRQDGLSPAYVFHVSAFAYTGQTIVSYNGERFSVYRTYETDENEIELYCEREVGSTGEGSEEP